MMPLLVASPLPLSSIHHAKISSDSAKLGGADAGSPAEPSGKGTTFAPIDEFDMIEPLSKWLDGYADDDSKMEFLRSQIIGAEAEFDSPFGRRRITYSDHTASGRFLRFVEEFLLQDVLPFYGNTHTVDSYVGLHTSKLVHQASQYIKHCMGAGPHDILLFCGTGCTAAIKRLQEVMGITVPSILRPVVLNHLPPSDRWVIFIGPYEHHSNLLSWRQTLAEVVEIGLDESGHIDLAALEAALESPEYSGRPKLGSFSACSNVTGVLSDTSGIAHMLHRHGAYACFDFACSAPYVNIEMRSGEVDGYDAVFLSPHKFIGGPGSPGILLMNEGLYRIKGTPPSTSGGGTVLYVSGHDVKDTVYCENAEEREDAGTPGIVQKIRAALAFCVKEWVGHVAIREREALFARRAMERIRENPKVRVLGHVCEEERQPIMSFLVYPDGMRGKHLHCSFVTKLLNDLFGIQGRGGCACAGPYGHVLLGIDRARSKAIKTAVERGYEGARPGWTRVSFAYYTSWKEMEFVVDAIEFVAEYGHRFLPLYGFDWKTGHWEYVGAGLVFPITNGGGNGGESYEDYIASARCVVNSIPNLSVERNIPKCIDPQLVNFKM
ncbi:probable cysteine desulfurase [Phoenix dactylifera]|uniref:Probable cysteine desulfurase n=1 Tax=Phoenix dactylifera TaxID=42345 RepID=A0A8B7BWJ7_PHODC|nr:probable cysteine desulfurase [Phoenix dactylifera]